MRLRIRPTIMVAAACLVVATTAALDIATTLVGSRIAADHAGDGLAAHYAMRAAEATRATAYAAWEGIDTFGEK